MKLWTSSDFIINKVDIKHHRQQRTKNIIDLNIKKAQYG